MPNPVIHHGGTEKTMRSVEIDASGSYMVSNVINTLSKPRPRRIPPNSH